MGGGDPDGNSRLRNAIADAKAVSMPKDNIARAIKKGAGETDGDNYEEFIYEGYASDGVAVMCDILTDNRNRTAPEVKKLFENHGGKLGTTGCVSFMFDRKGLFIIEATKVNEEALIELAMQAGADDISDDDGQFEVTCEPDAFSDVSESFENAGIECASAQVVRIPQNTVDLEVDAARTVLKLIDALDDHDDVQKVSANFNISDAVLAELGDA
jgi:YebC/PmpR family DNA-binding regulatory protein